MQSDLKSIEADSSIFIRQETIQITNLCIFGSSCLNNSFIIIFILFLPFLQKKSKIEVLLMKIDNDLFKSKMVL